MSTVAVVKSGGKQYIVKSGDVIVVDHVAGDPGTKVELQKLLSFTVDGKTVDTTGSTVSAEIIESGKGEKIRVAKFKAKVRYRKVTGFRPMLTKLKIASI